MQQIGKITLILSSLMFVSNIVVTAQSRQAFTAEEIRSVQKKGNTKTVILSAVKRSQRGDAYHLSGDRRILGGINSLLKVKWDQSLINDQKNLIDAMFNSAKPSSQMNSKLAFKDEYTGWISLTKGQSYSEEVPLFESYSFVYIAEFLYLLKERGWINESNDNRRWWQEKVAFVEKNGWEKWMKRSELKFKKKYTYFLRGRTHMGSHWAGVALYLEKISSDDKIRKQAREVYTTYDMLLKRNFKVVDGRYVWNSTYDDVTGTDATPSTIQRVQDTSHGNNVVAYIIAAEDLGNGNWTDEDIKLLIGTLKHAVYSSTNKTFNSYIDGTTDIADRSRFFLGDGWVKLSRYDEDLLNLFKQYSTDEDKMRVSNQEFQFNSNLMEAEKYRSLQ